MKLKRVGALDIEADERHHRSFIRVQRAGWLAIMLVLLSATAGLIGPGLIGMASVSSTDGKLMAEFFRTSTSHNDTGIRITAALEGKETLTLWISRDYAERFYLKEIIPQPTRVYAGADRVFYEFTAAPGTSEMMISLLAEPIEAGPVSGVIGAGANRLHIKQFIWP